MLDQEKKDINILTNLNDGLLWSSMVYTIININRYNIHSISPLDQNIYMVTWEYIKSYYKRNIFPYSISQEKWTSGLKCQPVLNMLARTRPNTPTDVTFVWSSSLDSIEGA